MNQIEVCERIAPVQRDRATTVRQRCRIENTRRAMIANRLGYHGGLPEAERKRIMKEADALIERIIEGEPHALSAQVITLEETIKQLKALEKGYDKRLAGLLRHLPPIVKWVESQRGLSLAGAAVCQVRLAMGRKPGVDCGAMDRAGSRLAGIVVVHFCLHL